jgi:hypothetical protein
MRLIHSGKTSKNEIPLDGAKAVLPGAFKTITTKAGDGTIEHKALAWTFHSVQQGADGKRAKYQDNTFELQFGVQELEKLEEAIKVAKERFAKAEVPGVSSE